MPARIPAELEERFRPLGVLGRGGQGTVLAVHDRELGRKVALKLQAPVRAPVILERFRREAQAMARLQHPGLPRIYSHGVAEGQPYMVTELLIGASLDRVDVAPEPGAMMLQVAEVLAFVHEHGLVHRDVKPQNVFLTHEGRVLLLDMGLVFEAERTRLTDENVVVGTLRFVGPETLRGARPTPASDWFGWAATLYWLLECEPPFTRDELFVFARGGELPPVVWRRTGPPTPLTRLVEWGLEGEPGDRLHGLEAIRRQLGPGGGEESGIRERGRPGARRWRPTLAVSAALALASLLLGVHLARPPAAPPPTVTTEEPASPPAPDEDWVRRLRAIERELDEIERSHVSPAGAVVTVEPGLAPPGSRPLLDADPLAWDRTLRSLPHLEATLRRLRQEEPPAKLPEVVRAGLRQVDRRFRAVGLPRPFFPHAYVRPAPRSGPLPDLLARGYNRFRLPDRVDGWLRVGLEAWARADRAREARERELEEMARGGPVIPALARAGMSSRVFAVGGFRHVVEVSLADRERRLALAPWLRGPVDSLHLAMVAGWQAARRPGDEGERAALLFRELVARERALLGSHLAVLEPEEIFLGPSTMPAAQLLAASIARLLAEALREAGLPGGRLDALRQAYLDAARRADRTRDRGPPSRLVALRRASVVEEQIRLDHDRGRHEEVVRTFLEAEDELYDALTNNQEGIVLKRVVRSWLEFDTLVPEATLARMQRWLEAHPDQARRRRLEDGLGELVGRLAVRRRMILEELAGS